MTCVRGVGVLPAIDFDDQTRRKTNEIAEICAERKLTAETQAVKLFATQFFPQQFSASVDCLRKARERSVALPLPLALGSAKGPLDLSLFRSSTRKGRGDSLRFVAATYNFRSLFQAASSAAAEAAKSFHGSGRFNTASAVGMVNADGSRPLRN